MDKMPTASQVDAMFDALEFREDFEIQACCFCDKPARSNGLCYQHSREDEEIRKSNAQHTGQGHTFADRWNNRHDW